MMHFADRLHSAIAEKKSCVLVGLDPRADAMPEEFQGALAGSRASAADAVLRFNIKVMEAVVPYTVAVKPQSAFYEALGWEGVRAYSETVRAAQERGLLVIGDVKRGDIGSTAEAYAEAHLDLIGADAITVNPYLGTDGIAPFLKRTAAGKGLFILVKTSNPSSGELQDLKVGEEVERAVPSALNPHPSEYAPRFEMVYERVAQLVNGWGKDNVGQSGYSAAGAVVGATYPEAAARLRQMMPRAIFLVPGYGAQGGSAQDCRPCFDRQGRGAIVNSSRGIIFAYGKSRGAGWEKAVAEAARKMRDELEAVRNG